MTRKELRAVALGVVGSAWIVAHTGVLVVYGWGIGPTYRALQRLVDPEAFDKDIWDQLTGG